MEPGIAKQHIERRAGVCDGKPCIAGTRIRVQDIYVWHELQMKSWWTSPSFLGRRLRGAVYFWDNRDEIKRQMQDEKEYVDVLKKKAGPGLLDRLKGKDAGRGLIPF